ncbi:MAG: GAF domain-containing protein [Tepidisphaerales bacterium]
MYQERWTTSDDKPSRYASVHEQLTGLLQGERDWIVNLANTSALLFARLPDLNWAGFYLWRGSQLVLGPFQGKPACTRIALGRGVCGTAAARRQTVLVPDVHAFPGHIACDSASLSEIVIPLLLDGRLLGVADLDSPLPARFDEVDEQWLERIVELLVGACDWADK